MFPFIKSPNTLVNIFIILLAVAPAFALGEGNKNLLLIGAMCFSPYFFIKYPVILPKIDIPLISICLMMIIFTMVFHPETLRWSTLMYSCLFCMFFMSFARVLSFSDYRADDFAKLIKWLLYAYCITLMIQQFCVLTGLPIFNLANYNPREPWKLNSLMAEPSHTARVQTLLMFFYINIQMYITDIKDIKKLLSQANKKVIAAFLYPIFTMGSGTGFLLLFILLLRFIPKKQIISLFIAGLLLTPAIIYVISTNDTAKRTADFVVAIADFDEKQLIKKDLSAAIRIVPTLHGAKKVTIFTKDGLFGKGVDADAGLTPLPSVDCGAGSFSIWYNFGIFSAIIFWSFTLFICFLRNDMVMSCFFWLFLCFFYGGLNIQIIWFTLALFLSYKYVTIKDYARNLG